MNLIRLLSSSAVVALAANGALAGDTDLIGADIGAQFNAAGWSNGATLGVTSTANSSMQAASVSVSSNLDFNVFGIGLGANSSWTFDSTAEGTEDLGADVTMTYAHDRDIDVTMLQDGAGTITTTAQSVGYLDVEDVSARGLALENGEIVTASAGGSLGGVIPNEDESPVASLSVYGATINSTDSRFIGAVEQDNYALTLAVVNASSASDGASVAIEGSDISVGDTLGVPTIGNALLDVANPIADFRDSVFSNGTVAGPIGGLTDPEAIAAYLSGPGIYYINPVGVILSEALDDTNDNFVVVTQLGGDANLSAVIPMGVGSITQSVSNTTIMSGGIFAGVTSTVAPAPAVPSQPGG